MVNPSQSTAKYRSVFGISVLLIMYRVDYKTARLVHQSLAGQTPTYLADDIQLVTDTDRRPLCLAAISTCFVPWHGRTTVSVTDRSFSAARSAYEEQLATTPYDRQDMNFARFQHILKTFLSGC